jgi:hypothetical protein
VVTGRRLTAWAMALPISLLNLENIDVQWTLCLSMWRVFCEPKEHISSTFLKYGMQELYINCITVKHNVWTLAEGRLEQRQVSHCLLSCEMGRVACFELSVKITSLGLVTSTHYDVITWLKYYAFILHIFCWYHCLLYVHIHYYFNSATDGTDGSLLGHSTYCLQVQTLCKSLI